MSDAPNQSGHSDGSRLVISKEQRNLLFERILRNVTGVDDALLEAVRREDPDEAERLSHRLCEELALVTNDLGWVDRADQRLIEVSTSPLIVRGVLERLRAEAKALDPAIDLRESAAENAELIVTCEELIASLCANYPGAGPRDVPAPPLGALTGLQVAQKEALRTVLASHPHEVGREEIILSISAQVSIHVDLVKRAVDELSRLELIRLGRSGWAASEGLVLVSQLWGDLSLQA